MRVARMASVTKTFALVSDLTSFLMTGSSVVVTVWKIRSIRCSGRSFLTLTLS